jgi:hypothetical protein
VWPFLPIFLFSSVFFVFKDAAYRILAHVLAGKQMSPFSVWREHHPVRIYCLIWKLTKLSTDFWRATRSALLHYTRGESRLVYTLATAPLMRLSPMIRNGGVCVSLQQTEKSDRHLRNVFRVNPVVRKDLGEGRQKVRAYADSLATRALTLSSGKLARRATLYP